MGGQAKFPASNTPGSGGSGFYQNALNQQKQAVANAPATQAAQTQSGAGEDSRYLDAYNTYMQQKGGSTFGQSQPPAPQQQPPARQSQSPMRRPMRDERPPASPKGINMGPGYANRPFG